jgi:hypothetical protein
MTAAGGIDPSARTKPSVFDVFEHIHNATSFLNDALFHLRPGGYVFVNVPAIQGLHSRFDDVLGHVRRYDRGLLSRRLVEAGLDVLSVRCWALTMIPVIYVRTLLVNFFTDADKILDVGFKPPRSSDISCAIRAPFV